MIDIDDNVIDNKYHNEHLNQGLLRIACRPSPVTLAISSFHPLYDHDYVTELVRIWSFSVMMVLFYNHVDYLPNMNDCVTLYSHIVIEHLLKQTNFELHIFMIFETLKYISTCQIM